MATTRHILVAETTGKGGRPGRKVRLALGVAIIGGVAALAFGGTRHPRPAAQAAQPATGTLDWEQVERAQIAPAQAIIILDWEQAERAHVAPGTAISILDWEQEERKQVAP